MDLQGPLDPPQIVGVDLASGDRIDPGEFGMQRGQALPGGAVAEGAAKIRIGRGSFEQALHQGLHVEGRPAGHDHRPASGGDGGDGGVGEFGVAFGGERLAGLDDIYQVVRDTVTAFRSRLGCTNVHPAVYFHGVGDDDLGAEALRQAGGGLILAAGGAADNDVQADGHMVECIAGIGPAYRSHRRNQACV